MPQYLLLPYDSPEAFQDVSPDQMQKIIQRYVEWTGQIAQSGALKSGERLRDGVGKTLRGSGKKMTVTDGPFSETKEVLGGFWIIEAKSMEDAMQIASGCPHLDFGTLAIREIEPN